MKALPMDRLRAYEVFTTVVARNGFARAADALDVDIIQNCEVTAINRDAQGRVSGVETTRGPIRTT
ncbi:hypothetical protein, partial [Klebsiella pneumoniae]|uniref:hypothetical protein n=1 Tax=Klebsiella pneumoniae TaxID=573 RepID=UPI0038544EBB